MPRKHRIRNQLNKTHLRCSPKNFGYVLMLLGNVIRPLVNHQPDEAGMKGSDKVFSADGHGVSSDSQ